MGWPGPAQNPETRFELIVSPRNCSARIGMSEIVHIPAKPRFPPDQQPTVDVIAAVIEPKLTNTIVRRLNQIAPLEDLRHVKRVQKKLLEGGNIQLSVILCLADDDDLRLVRVPSDIQELIKAYQLSIFSAKVCRYAALSKEEWEEQCKLWPTSYHPPTYNIDGITGFSEEESFSVSSFMRSAVDLAKFGSMVANAAVIVDPSTKQVIARASDETFSLCTPTSIGGVQKCCSERALDIDHESRCLDIRVSCLLPWQWASLQSCQENDSNWHPLRHAAIVAIENAAAKDRHFFPGPGQIVDSNDDQRHLFSPVSPAKQQKMTTDINVLKDVKLVDAAPEAPPSESVRPYLCTGYDIYIAWEPCIMCAMALVHQRIRRIFYAFPNVNAGALGSVHRLQGERSLNHHYAVFRVLLPNESLDK